MKDRKKQLRLQFFIKSGLQAHFLRVNILLTIFISLAAAISIYQLSMQILGPNLEEVYPPGLLKGIYASLKYAFTLRMVGILVIVTITTFFITHRIAGPAYHIDQHLDEIAGGNLTKKIHLRKNDELKSIASKLNQLTDRLCLNLSSMATHLENMEKLCEKLKHGALDRTEEEKFNASLKEVKKLLSEFKFKT